jgi:7-cyano-7-deazaguanine reductase
MSETHSPQEYLKNSPLGRNIPHLKDNELYPIPRNIHSKNKERTPTYFGADIWHAYELSWLGPNGRPEACIARFTIPSSSPYIIESKSFKLFLNSFNNQAFSKKEELIELLNQKLSHALGSSLDIELLNIDHTLPRKTLSGICLDHLKCSCQYYDPSPALIKIKPGANHVNESVHTHLFRSNCPVTFQPDWASIQIHYQGPALSHESLLQYLVSYRNHAQFHEHCVETIFNDLLFHTPITNLYIAAQFTRRGGLDINPIRSTQPQEHWQAVLTGRQ